jgi:hypothetical protein
MDIKIDEDTLEKTKYCEKGFSCLSGENECLCEVKYSAGYNIFILILSPIEIAPTVFVLVLLLFVSVQQEMKSIIVIKSNYSIEKLSHLQTPCHYPSKRHLMRRKR